MQINIFREKTSILIADRKPVIEIFHETGKNELLICDDYKTVDIRKMSFYNHRDGYKKMCIYAMCNHTYICSKENQKLLFLLALFVFPPPFFLLFCFFTLY